MKKLLNMLLIHMKTIRAIYERGVFIPTEPVELPESAEVELEARPVSGDAAIERKLAKISQILGQRHKPIEAGIRDTTP